MKLNNVVLLTALLLLSSCGNSSTNSYENASSYDSTSDNDEDDEDDEDDEEETTDASGQGVTPDGDYDCSASNITRGNGPYSLGCEKDGDDVTIHFNNGGHITVDEDGYDTNTGEQWDVELD